MNKKKIYCSGIIVILALVFFYWQNNHIMITKLELIDPSIDKEFHGFKILQISDLHNKDFGKQLLNKVKNESPDIIVITGDLVDSRNTNIDSALKTVESFIQVAPILYVTGNHESRIENYNRLEEGLLRLGVILLSDQQTSITRGDNSIVFIGLTDPSFYGRSSSDLELQKHMKDVIESNMGQGMNVLLSHRPELMELYNSTKVNIVFSGHAHGGQVRLPIIGGIVAPDQGLLPKYDSGIYKGNNTAMIVSRGLGNSIIPLRIFNRPEIVVLTLK